MATITLRSLDTPTNYLQVSGQARQRCAGTLHQQRKVLEDALRGRSGSSDNPTTKALQEELQLVNEALALLAKPSTRILSDTERRERREQADMERRLQEVMG